MKKDILINTEGDFDLMFTDDGDIAVGDAGAQAMNILLAVSPGDYKDYPLFGIDITRSIGGNYAMNSFTRQRIITQLKALGYYGISLNVTSSEINLSATSND